MRLLQFKISKFFPLIVDSSTVLKIKLLTEVDKIKNLNIKIQMGEKFA